MCCISTKIKNLYGKQRYSLVQEMYITTTVKKTINTIATISVFDFVMWNNDYHINN